MSARNLTITKPGPIEFGSFSWRCEYSADRKELILFYKNEIMKILTNMNIGDQVYCLTDFPTYKLAIIYKPKDKKRLLLWEHGFKRAMYVQGVEDIDKILLSSKFLSTDYNVSESKNKKIILLTIDHTSATSGRYNSEGKWLFGKQIPSKVYMSDDASMDDIKEALNDMDKKENQ